MTYKEFRSLVLNTYYALSEDTQRDMAIRYKAMHPDAKGSLGEKLKEELSQINPMEFKTFASGFIGHGRENSIAKNSLLYDLVYNYLTPEERLKIKDGATNFNVNPFQDLNDDDFYRNLTWGTDRFKFDPNTKEAYLDGGNTFNWAYDMLDYGLDPNNVYDRNKYIGWMKEAQTRWNNQEYSNPRNFTMGYKYNPQYRENGFHPLEWLTDKLIEGQWGNTQKNIANGKQELANSDLVANGLDIVTAILQSPAKMPLKAVGYALDLANPFIREGIETLNDDDKNFGTYVNNLGDMFSESTMRGAGNVAGGLIGDGVSGLAKKVNSPYVKNVDEYIQSVNAKDNFDVFSKNMEKQYAKEGNKPILVDEDQFPLDGNYSEFDAFGQERPVKVVKDAPIGEYRLQDDYNISDAGGDDFIVTKPEQDDLADMYYYLYKKERNNPFNYDEAKDIVRLSKSNQDFGKMISSDYKVFENPFLDGLTHYVLHPQVDRGVAKSIGKFSAYATRDGLVEPSVMKPEELTTIASNIRNTKPKAYDNYLRYGYVGNLSDYEIKVLKEYALKTKSAAPLSQPNKSWDAYSVFN